MPAWADISTPEIIKGRPIPTDKLKLRDTATPRENPIKIVRLDKGCERRNMRNSDEL